MKNIMELLYIKINAIINAIYFVKKTATTRTQRLSCRVIQLNIVYRAIIILYLILLTTCIIYFENENYFYTKMKHIKYFIAHKTTSAICRACLKYLFLFLKTLLMQIKFFILLFHYNNYFMTQKKNNDFLSFFYHNIRSSILSGLKVCKVK